MNERTQQLGLKAAQRCLVSVALAVGLAPAAHALNSDWHAWLTQSAGMDITSNTAVQFNQSFRFASEPSKLSSYYLEGGYIYGWREWLDLAAYYRQQYAKSADSWQAENRPYVDVTPRVKFGEFTLFDRNRLEYRHFEDAPDTTRYRNKLALQSDGDWLGWGLKPYVAAEAFVSESANLHNRDQTQYTIGVRTDPTERLLKYVKRRRDYRLSMDHFFTLQRVLKNNEWADQYILGLTFGVFF